MAKKKFDALVSIIGGTSPANFFKSFRGSKVDFKYYPRFLASMGLMLFAAPFALADRLLNNSRVRNYKIEQPPVFILGHWRSGTTFLHNLLTQDPQFGYVTTYHSIFPNHLFSTAWIFKNFMKKSMPKERAVDNVELSVDYPQEEEFAMGGAIPYSFYHFWFFPERWKEYCHKYILFEGVNDNVKSVWKRAFHRLVKQALLNTGGPRFISKNPPNTGRVAEILELFPDAKFVSIHRNPISVIQSTQNFFSQTIVPLKFSDISEEEMEENILYVYKQLFDKFEQDKSLIPAHNLIELKYEDFIADPLPEVKMIYDRLDITGFDQTKAKFELYINSQKKHRKNSYQMSKDEVDRLIRSTEYAMEHWGYSLPDNLEIVNN